MGQKEMLSSAEQPELRGTCAGKLFGLNSRDALRHFAFVFAILWVCLPSCMAQVSARLSGVITDPSGATVAGAAVMVKSLDTGISRTAATDAKGRYGFFALPIGEYEIRVTKDGFAEGIR